MSAPTAHREVERKLRVDDRFPLPDLVASGAVAVVEPRPAFTMVAVYHDTDSLALFRWGTTLRRREGGDDEGWHLKLPVAGADGGTRDEVRLPLAAGRSGVVPAALADIISPLARGAHLAPQATIRTTRQPTLLRAADGRALLELVDDRVESMNADGSVHADFRELEVEVCDPEDPDAHAMLDRVVEVLLAAGAQPGSLSKAAGALGLRATAPADVPALPLPVDGFAADVIRSALATHVRHFLMADVAVRRNLPDAVHQMRVAARRMRSILKTYAPLIDPEWAGLLREELGWIARELGTIRDTEVLLRRLDEDADLLGEPDASQARGVIDERLQRRLDTGRSGALAALRSDRHAWLIEDLIDAATDPRLQDSAFQPVDALLPDLLAGSWRRLARVIPRLTVDGPAEEWHAARIIAKRTRYTVESVVPLLGDRARVLADALADVTEVLGEHQDACIAQEALREFAASTAGPAAFSLGRLHDVEGERAALARLSFLDLWPEVRRTAKRTEVVPHGR